MQGIYFLLSLIAVFVVIFWLLRQDGKGGAHHGLLAMKQPDAFVKREKRKRKQWQHPAERDASETPDP